MSTCKYIDANIVEKSFDPKTVDETRKMKFVISTAKKDRGGEVINMENWSLDNYHANPVVGYQHAIYGGGLFTDPNPDMIIGKSVVNLDTFKSKRVLVAEPEFEPKEINEIAEKVFQKLKFGSLNTASVGILPVGQGKFNKEEKTYYYDGQELLEWSVVNIPMNGEARRMSMKSLMVAQADELTSKLKLSDDLRKMIFDAIEKEYGGKAAEAAEQETSGPDPDLSRYKEVINKFKK